LIGFLAFLLPFTLFLGIPSAMWNFDGVACAIALELGTPAYLFHADHLLYGFFGYLFWKIACIPVGVSRALPALQIFSSLLSALGLVGLYRLLLRVVTPAKARDVIPAKAGTQNLTGLGPDFRRGDEIIALLLTLALSVTAAFWVWSIEAQVYPLGFLPLAWASLVLMQNPRKGKYLYVGLLHGLAVLGHVMHFLWAIPVLYWMRQESAFKRKALAQYAGSLAAATLVPYAIVLLAVILPARNSTHLSLWLKGSVGLSADRSWTWHSAGWIGPWIWLKSTAPALWGSFWPYGRTVVGRWNWGATMISGSLYLFLLFRALKHAVIPAKAVTQNIRLGPDFRRGDGRLVRFALAWLGVYGLFLSTWEPATLCYRMTDIIPLGILLAVGLKPLKAGAQAVLVSLLLGSTFCVNASSRIGPMHRPEENPLYQDALALSKITSPDSLYISEGGMFWIYILYFTGRTAWNRHSLAPLRLTEEIARQKKIRPVYIQSGSSWEQVR